MNRRTATRALIASLIALAALPVHAQKTYVSQCTGSAILLKADGTIIKAEEFYPVGFGDIIATGSGSAKLASNGGFRATLSADTIVTFCYSGPLSSSRALIELVAGTISYSDSGNGRFSPYLLIDGLETKATADTRTATIRMDKAGAIEERVASLRAELEELETKYALETANMNQVNEQYRDLLAARSEVADGVTGDVAAFRTEELFPAEDARSTIIGEISRRETVLRAIRAFVLAPRYMREKTMNPFVSPGALGTTVIP